MKLINLTYTIFAIAISAKESCPGPFEVGTTVLSAYYCDTQIICRNYNRITGCRHRDYTTPEENHAPGGCQKRDGPPIADARIWKYDCKSAEDSWNFASEMVNKYNLTCDFAKNDSL
jgi:hypothetical protein